MKYTTWMLLVFIVLAAGVYVGVRRYKECRAHGFSKFYCLTQR